MIEPLVIFVSLVLARVGTFVAVLPLLGGAQVPRTIKVGLCAALAGLWSITFLDEAGGEAVLRQAQAVSWLPWGLALAREAGLGALFGFAFNLFLVPARVAGEFIAQELGLTFANEALGGGDGSAGPLTVILDLLATLLFFGLDLHHLFLTVLHVTFRRFPVGQGFSIPVCDVVGQATAAQEWGLVLAGPVLACLFLTTTALALMTRAAPQLNLFTVGFPLRMLIGLGALLFFLPQLVHGLVRMTAHLGELLARMA